MKSVSKSLRCLTTLALLFAVAVCNTTPSVTVKTDYDHAVTFGKYHNYALDTSLIRLGPTGSATLESALRSGQAGRGLRDLAQAAVGSTERDASAIQEAVNKIVAAYAG